VRKVGGPVHEKLSDKSIAQNGTRNRTMMNPADSKIFNPWNSTNQMITQDTVERILRAHGWRGTLTNPAIFQQACVHKSYVSRPELWAEQAASTNEPMEIAPRPDDCMDLKDADNEELEFVGDSILGNIVALYVFDRYPGEGEGFMTKLKTRIVNNKTLGELARKMGFSPWMIISRHVEEVCNGRNNLRMLGSMLEAWIGAMYFHEGKCGRGFEACQKWLIKIIEKYIDFSGLITEDNNFKDQLLRFYQGRWHQPPRYKEVDVVGPPHDRVFTMGVLDIDGNIVATYTARNKKVAEQEASRLALEVLEKRESEEA
jgi:ribonuclease-3